MVPRCGLMQRQRLHTELRLGLEVESVYVEIARAHAIRRGRLIEPARAAFRTERLHFAHFVVRLREKREQARQQDIDTPLDLAVFRDKIATACEIEPRVVLHETEKSRQITDEASFSHHAAHLIFDTRHLGETQLVNLLGAERGGSALSDAQGIPLFAMRQGLPTETGAARRHIIALEVVREA